MYVSIMGVTICDIITQGIIIVVVRQSADCLVEVH